MAQWSKDELEQAFAGYTAAVDKSVKTGDWEHFVQCFTPDATYVEHAYGNFSGHEEIRTWVTRTMGSFPATEMTEFPAKWVTVDVDKGWVICEIDNPMRDPGDGSKFAQSNITILRYAGNGLFGEEEDVYNPMDFMSEVSAYVQRCAELGTLTDEARRWAERFGVSLPPSPEQES
ncbi:nuclear transport factor 2 family protein [Nocardioides sp. Bht2]|uniref:nuclear transport factor 2 family protein n=1 Tax=Nocardioides sp. Bht2 TaxID=3392297 RepID=UPI0039B65E21